MPPKKKEEDVDLSSLPQAKIVNAMVFCKGKRVRAEAILSKINQKYERFLFHVQKAAVLDHAKEKGIYVNPETLTDKQKKDPKFMETVCTQMTPEVLAKSTESFINQHSIKFRLEMKANAEKPEEERITNNHQFDCVYIFDDYPTETAEFEALSEAKQKISFVIVIDPKLSWSSAPEMPDEDDPSEEVEAQDPEIVEYKRLLENQKFNEDDEMNEKEVSQRIGSIQNARKFSSRQSAFRNTVIKILKPTIDPYSEEASIQQTAQHLISQMDQLISEQQQFQDWQKDKKAQKIMDQIPESPKAEENKEEEQKEEEQKEGEEKQEEDRVKKNQKQKQLLKFSGNSTLEVLLELTSILQKSGKSEEDQARFDNQDANLDNFQFGYPLEEISKNQREFLKDKNNEQIIQYNCLTKEGERKFSQQLFLNLKVPGVNRFLMPPIAAKSKEVRKKYRSSFGKFLPENMTFEEFERKLDILNLQEAAKEVDEERTYNFSDRVFEEQHDNFSLVRELNNAFLFDESNLCTKYNENNDKLYVAFLYKNPVRRVQRKAWQSNWKVLPNFQNWLHYFKQNETNLSNQSYFDIDYELIGHIHEEASIFSVKDGGIIAKKNLYLSNENNPLLYTLLSQQNQRFVFGLRKRGQFYAQNQSVKIVQTQIQVSKVAETESQQKLNTEVLESYKSTFLSFADRTVIELKSSNGDIIIRKPGHPDRLITRKGYTVIYNKEGATILHPDGGISSPPSQYVNENGHGMKNGVIQDIPSLKRKTADGKEVFKRDDGTMMMKDEKQKYKWIKFPDSTEYQSSNKTITIEKEGYPVVKCEESQLTINYNGVIVNSSNSKDSAFESQIKFMPISNANLIQLTINDSVVRINDGKTETPYICNLEDHSIRKQWEGQALQVWQNKSQYSREGKVLNAEEDEENYSEQDRLQEDIIPPRLFIINNDNTGKQLFSKSQIQWSYLKTFQQVQELQGKKCEQFTTVLNDGSNREVKNGAIFVKNMSELNNKKIKAYESNMDIYSTKKTEKIGEKLKNTIQMRSLIQNTPLSEKDREVISNMINERGKQIVKMEKEDNEYGYKSKNDPSTEFSYFSKKKQIQFRQKPEQPSFYEEIKDRGVKHFAEERNRREVTLENMRKEEELKKRLSRKKSYVSQYNWIQPAPSPYNEDLQYYTQNQQFYASYFQTVEGKKALKEMPEWIFKPKQKKKQQELDPEIAEELNATFNKTKKQSQMDRTEERRLAKEQEEKERYDTVEVDLSPTSQIYIKPSVFTQREIDEERSAFQSQKKAYQYHEIKRKDYDIYGRQRKEKAEVPSLMRTQPISELNQKYLVTEAPVDKKVKIASMKNKLTSQASNMTEMRKEGPHANLIRTLDKRNDYGKLLERRTMMVQADLNDRLQRDIQINPIQANFGTVKEGSNYEIKIQIKNQDVLSQRIILKKPKSVFCKVSMNQMGPLALGMSRKIVVQIRATAQILGRFADEFDIVTKHEIYHIPISANIISKSQFETSKAELSRGVKEYQQISKKKKEELPPLN